MTYPRDYWEHSELNREEYSEKLLKATLTWGEIEQWPEKPIADDYTERYVRELINYQDTTSWDNRPWTWVRTGTIDYLVDKMCANCVFFTMTSPCGWKLSGSNSQGACRGAVDVIPAFDSYLINQKHYTCDLFQWNGKNYLRQSDWSLTEFAEEIYKENNEL
jgi:hypothetical protein